MTTWVVVANAAKADLYSSENLRTDALHPIKKLAHPDSRKKVTDLMCDRPGHYVGSGGSHGAFMKGDPKEVEAEHFALQLVKELKAEHDQKKYSALVIVAPPHFYSLIKKHFSFHIEDLKHIPKDYTKYELPRLTASVKEHIFV